MQSKYLNLWKKEIEDRGYEFISLKNPFYMYFEEEKMKQMIKEYIKLFEKNQDYIVICHSFGGILFNGIYQKLRNVNIKKAIIINSPLNMDSFGMKEKKKVLGYNPNLKYSFEVLSFGAYFDFLVPFIYTKYGKKHYNFFTEHHFGVFYSKKNIRRYLDISQV